MTARFALQAVFAAGMLAAVAGLVWPTIALAVQCVIGEGPPDGVSLLTTRQAVLLLKSAALAGGASLLAVLLALPAATAITWSRPTTRFLLLVCLSGVILCPPMVYVFGWQRLVPPGADPWMTCVFVWAAWAWPVAALVLASGWRASQGAFEAAVLAAGRGRATVHVLIPQLGPYAGVSALAIFIVLFGDYGVPHACGLIVYATEMLGWAANSTRPIETLAPSLPAVAVVLVGLSAIVRLTRGRTLVTAAVHSPCGGSWVPAAAAFGLVAMTAGLPIGALALGPASAEAFREAVRVYSGDLLWSFVAAISAAVLVVAFAAGTVAWGGTRRGAAVWAIVWGALPGALVGKALVAGFNRPGLAPVYDHATIVGLGHFARFAWLGALAGLVMARDLRGEPAALAALDGATRSDVVRYVVLPAHRRLLAALLFAVTALGMAEVPATSLVRVPTFTPVSLAIIEKFHRLEDGMLSALSLILVLAGIPAAVAIAWAWRRPT